MDFSNPEKLALLSPFELKDALIEVASRQSDRLMLNAGRGNPNFLATTPRHGFFQFGLFAMSEAERSYMYMEDIGGFPQRDGIEARFEIFAKAHPGVPGVDFIEAAVSYVRDQLGLSVGDFIYEMCEAILGCNYPVPDRMLRLSEKIVGQYIHQEMIGTHPFVGNFDMYAVEGGTAAMTYIFNSLRENHILEAGDTIALGMPIFTPYIEIPLLNDYQLVELMIDAPAENNWQFTKKELDKLLDPKVKAFFLVNPSNPPSVKMSDEVLAYLADVVKQRPDLIILTDDVYGTFADNFVSLFAICPHNTILVYSFSKYFGATGWRMGVVATHENNVIDEKIANLPEEKRLQLDKRYSSITTDPRGLKFIDRLVADSRTVALNHTAGVSTPVQAQMTLFSLFSLMDEAEDYKKSMKRIVLRRKEALYRELGLPMPHDPNSVRYYHLLDLGPIATQMYGAEFATWMLKLLKPNEALFRLAEETGVILLPGRGFGTQHQSARVSLANLNEYDYANIGRSIRKMAAEFYAQFLAEKKA
ncbi:bifunctional aspartate transaminase/aspartate 4-decarboxylase [Herbaspirillum sp. RTI4]|uniref:bifunctional aspartate transaminase/aspartate 4-decarboxylase n=1 Tax=Herbaspirillum sp. RTI4 TaxID=3048640 RepID=UPI002AB5B12C|nr:bifunctional aspartate transaminase/aspartate 4-decarboxylase [Herbaspirillum sp. RTI4]MDY7578953.1 bifunctional aspartate transaminase/aspartate 4-decarboxylase [Herbaspirillum sp. RTI4]MEA9980884.1 bifunctional aspartate transaminase/aspartate 4-decarboxylase [Herbaspirillum sp. RTI4]